MSSSQSALPPGDHSPLIKVVSWFLLVVSILTIITRLLTRWSVSKVFHLDDLLATCSLFCYVGSVVAVSVQAENGFGKPGDSPSQFTVFSKSGYAADMLYIATVCLAKLSISALLKAITPSTIHQKISIFLGGFILVLGIVSEFCAAFQCAHPSDLQNRCFDRVAFWRFYAVMNIATDICLMTIPILIVFPLQMAMNTKFIVLGCFGARSLDIVASSVQLAYTSSFNSSNFIVDIWEWTLIGQVVQCLTLITSCMPYIRPLLKSLSTGLYSSDDTRKSSVFSYGYSRAKNERFNMRPYPQSGSDNSDKSQVTRVLQDTPDTIHLSPALPVQSVVSAQKFGDAEWDDISRESQSKILKTTTMTTSWA